MNRFARWFKRQGVQENPSLIWKLGGLLFLAMILGAWGIFPDAMAIIGVLLGFCIFLLGVLTLFLAALRGPLVEDETPPVFIVPGEPGHRAWRMTFTTKTPTPSSVYERRHQGRDSRGLQKIGAEVPS